MGKLSSEYNANLMLLTQTLIGERRYPGIRRCSRSFPLPVPPYRPRKARKSQSRDRFGFMWGKPCPGTDDYRYCLRLGDGTTKSTRTAYHRTTETERSRAGNSGIAEHNPRLGGDVPFLRGECEWDGLGLGSEHLPSGWSESGERR